MKTYYALFDGSLDGGLSGPAPSFLGKRQKRGQKKFTYSMVEWGRGVVIETNLAKIKGIRESVLRYQEHGGITCNTIIAMRDVPRKITIVKVKGASRYNVMKEGEVALVITKRQQNGSSEWLWHIKRYRSRKESGNLFSLNMAILVSILDLTNGVVVDTKKEKEKVEEISEEDRLARLERDLVALLEHEDAGHWNEFNPMSLPEGQRGQSSSAYAHSAFRFVKMDLMNMLKQQGGIKTAIKGMLWFLFQRRLEMEKKLRGEDK